MLSAFTLLQIGGQTPEEIPTLNYRAQLSKAFIPAQCL